MVTSPFKNIFHTYCKKTYCRCVLCIYCFNFQVNQNKKHGIFLCRIKEMYASSFSFNPNYHASANIQLHRNTSASLLSNDLTVIEKWGKDNLVSFNQSKTKQAVISRKHNQNFPSVLMNGNEIDLSTSFPQQSFLLLKLWTWEYNKGRLIN